MSTASTGRRREYFVRDHMIQHGWRAIMRAAASKGSADLLMGHEIHGAALVQVGSKSKALGPADRHRFTDDADLIGALPLLAIVVPRAPLIVWRVTTEAPGKWDRYDIKEAG
ncbi:MAG: hypothetical protein PGN07_04665 [Aeromicrobium erythreum]